MFQNKFIVNVCLTGIIPTRESTPYVPITPEEIASDVAACIDLGASMFHVHARNKQHQWDWRKETYQAIMDAIRSVSPDVIVCFTTTGRKTTNLSKRTACLDTDPPPHMASLSMGSFNFRDDATVNDPKTIEYLLSAMRERGIKPEVEIFDLGMARTTQRMMEQGLLKGPVYANLILGNDSTAGDSLIDVATLHHHLPDRLIWCAGGIGRTQQRSNVLGILYGGGVRVGIEDNPYNYNGLRDKTPVKNAFFVERIRDIGRLLGKDPLSIDETRKLLGLSH
jgi:3-keto-5-aminohexanoate cleavage enzyme